MKIEHSTQPRPFDPVTITIESEGELAFFRDVLGRTNLTVGRAYGVQPNVFTKAYSALNSECCRQNAPGYMSQGISIEFNRKE